MEHTKKMVLVSQETIHRMKNSSLAMTDVSETVSVLDREMEKILRMPKISYHERWNLYKQCLQRFLHFSEEERKPATLAFSTVDNRIRSEIVASVPKKFKKKAQLLVDRLASSGNIKWDKMGSISIRGNKLTGTNIIDLEGDLMRKRKKLFSPRIGTVSQFSNRNQRSTRIYRERGSFEIPRQGLNRAFQFQESSRDGSRIGSKTKQENPQSTIQNLLRSLPSCTLFGRGEVMKSILRWLESEESYTVHKPIRRNFPRNRYVVDNIDDLWKADLNDMRDLKSENAGYGYILTIIDVFSKYSWAIPIKTKTASEVIAAFSKILSKSKRKPTKDIVFYHTNNPDIKAAVVKRLNRTKGSLQKGVQIKLEFGNIQNRKDYTARSRRLQGTFYEDGIQRVRFSKSSAFKIDKIIKTRGVGVRKEKSSGKNILRNLIPGFVLPK
ncbi:hypothetical protein J437_LFUL006961 [Ladona fulva]|uniref:Integrase catalytic domain-containing protein n=1 Tax=Ladona fulva TaxID=123851 RepID=A0A8K0P0L9_LADFU|nr:hypothetical protein J437_LFUL006961 [Ladona fulva]